MTLEPIISIGQIGLFVIHLLLYMNLISEYAIQANFAISQALVTDISYANASFYGCSFASFQDTWYTGRNGSTYVVDSVIFGQTDCECLA